MAQSWKDMWLVPGSPRKQPVSAGRCDGTGGKGVVWSVGDAACEN